MNKNINLLVLLIVTIIIVFVVMYALPKNKEGFQSKFDFNEVYLKGSQGPQGETGSVGPHGPPGADGPACRNIISYLEDRGHLSLGETNPSEELDVPHQLELKGNVISKSVNFSKLKITDYDECYPIMIGNNENDADFYIKKGTSDCKMFIKGNLEIGGNITFKDTKNNNISIDASKLFYSLAPIGIIACFYRASSIPESWAICDGQSIEGFQTPDLSGKFIKGTTNMDDNGTTNDDAFGDHKTKEGKITLKNENMPIHNHTIHEDGEHLHTITSNESGFHNHSLEVKGGSVASDTVTDNYVLSATQGTQTNIQTQNEDNTHRHTVTVSSSGGHTHTLDEHGLISPQPIDIMPPYYTLVYIIKYK